MSSAYAYVLAFVVGVLITATELSATPLLAPVFGTSLIVWTAVIGIVLAGLALGYWLGGRLADRSSDWTPLLVRLAIASVLVALIPFLAAWLFPSLSLTGVFLGTVSFGRFLSVFLAMLVSFVVPMVLMSMTSPYVISLLQREASSERVGRVAGRVYMVSTFGSLVGVILGPLVVLPLVGTRWLFLGSAILLFVLVVVPLVRQRSVVVSVLVGGGLLLASVFSGQFSPLFSLQEGDVLLEESESFLQSIAVVERPDGERQLRVNEGLGVQSSWYPDRDYTETYTDVFAALPLARAATLSEEEKRSPRSVSVLFVGLAGGSGPRALEAGFASVSDVWTLKQTGLEIDAEMVRLARAHMQLDTIDSLTVRVADGRSFLRETNETYDYIFLDAFQNETTAPPELTTQEWFEAVRSRLRPGGVMAMNMVFLRAPSERAETPVLQRHLETTIASVFSNVFVVDVPQFHNVLLMATDDSSFDPTALAEVDSENAAYPEALRSWLPAFARAETVSAHPATRVLTDDWSPVHLLTAQMVVEFFLGDTAS